VARQGAMRMMSAEIGVADMKKLVIAGGLIVATQILGSSSALAGPWEDGMAAYNRGDYAPAMELFRPLARRGNAQAQAVIGAMYRKGQGVAKSSARAFMWLSLASARSDAVVRTEMKEMSRTMSAAELTQARKMIGACEASDYRDCEY
jgi:TPR repeat protein